MKQNIKPLIIGPFEVKIKENRRKPNSTIVCICYTSREETERKSTSRLLMISASSVDNLFVWITG